MACWSERSLASVTMRLQGIAGRRDHEFDRPVANQHPSGIGLETSILMYREGCSLLMADISGPALEKAAARVRSLAPHMADFGGKLETIICDVTKESDVQAMVEKLDAWGGVDVMFNNAGIMHADDAGKFHVSCSCPCSCPCSCRNWMAVTFSGRCGFRLSNYGRFADLSTDAIDTPEKIWDLTHNINVKGVWYGCKHAVISLRKHDKTKASIINTASVVALVGSATPQLAYTASKGAVLAMTRELAIVHAREGFRFNALCPAPLK